MIATILPGSSNFHAVGYNEHKVSQGNAQLLEMKNFGSVGKFGSYTVKELTDYLQLYSSCNDRIRKSQFHVAISCKGREYSEEELLDFAHRYLDEMGYGQEGQPVLIYAHRDTDNNHLHIITSRVSPDGRKIDHNHERRHSQQVIAKLMGENREETINNDIMNAKEYTFGSLAQFKSILTSIGYEVYEKDGVVNVKKGGMVQQKIPIAEIDALIKRPARDRKREKQLKAILIKYRDNCNNRLELEKELKSKFGISLVFFGKKDSPYGYMLVDHNRKMVYNGASILKLDALLDFTGPEEKLERIDAFIDKLLETNPKTTTNEIYSKIRKARAWIKCGKVYYKSESISRELKKAIAETIRRNDIVAFIEYEYRPSNAKEVEFLCRKFGIEQHTELVDISSQADQTRQSAIRNLQELFSSLEGAALRSALRERGFAIKKTGEDCFAINYRERRVIYLNNESLPIWKLFVKNHPDGIRQKAEKSNSHKSGNFSNSLSKGKKAGAGSREANREWEVGSNRNPDDLDNGAKINI